MLPTDQTLRVRLTQGALILLALALCGAVLLCAAQAWVRPSQLPEGYVVHACVGSTGAGLLRVGGWWLSPHLKDAPRWAFVSPAFPACAYIPWLPFLPQGGSLMLP